MSSRHPPGPSIPTSTRRAKRIIESPSSSDPSSVASSPKPASPGRGDGRRRGAAQNVSYAEPDEDEDEDDDDLEELIGDEDEEVEGEEDELEDEGEDELAQDEVPDEEEEEEEEQMDIDGEGEEIDELEEEENGEEDDVDEGGSDLEADGDGEEDVEEASTTRKGSAAGSALKIKLTVIPTSKQNGNAVASGSNLGERPGPGRPPGKKSSKKGKKVAIEQDIGSEEDELLDDDNDHDIDMDSMGGDSRRSLSPSKLTARQRAKGNKDLQEVLLALPNDPGNKKLVLTEAERLQRREEMARRRKRQTEQKLQDEQDQTINRLLRAQTGRSRSKLDGPTGEESGTAGPSRLGSPSKRARVEGDMIRWVSSIVGDRVVVRVAAPKGKDEWIGIGSRPTIPDSKTDLKSDVKANGGLAERGRATCAVEGCEERRKYRSVKRFEVGGCSLQHLKQVEAGIQ